MPNLTPVSYAVLAAICASGIVHQWADGGFPWWRLLLVAYLAGLAYEWTRVRSSRIRVTLQSTAPLPLGKTAGIAFLFENADRVPIRVQFVADLPREFEVPTTSLEVRLAAESSREVAVSVRPLALGRFDCQRLPLRIRGPLFLAWWWRPQHLNASVTVSPDMLAVGNKAAGIQRAGLAMKQRAGIGQELHHLREYRPGDPRHTIDWKATARSGGLVTRVFGEDQHLEIVLILDTGRTSRTRIDGLSQLGHYVNLAARFTEHAVAHEDQIGMVAVADRPVAVVPPSRGTRAVIRMRHALAALQTVPVESDLLSAATELSRYVRRRCLIIVLTDLYGGSAKSRLMQSIRLWVPQHLPMVVGLVGGELKLLAEQPARDWLDPYKSLAAGTYQEDLVRGSEGLKRLGAHTLICRPRDLERQVFNHYQMLKAQRRV